MESNSMCVLVGEDCVKYSGEEGRSILCWGI